MQYSQGLRGILLLAHTVVLRGHSTSYTTSTALADRSSPQFGDVRKLPTYALCVYHLRH